MVGPAREAFHKTGVILTRQSTKSFLTDQRGCGRSRPHVRELRDLEINTTAHLIGDLEHLREHLRIDRWSVLGASWGKHASPSLCSGIPRSCDLDGLSVRDDDVASRGAMDNARHGPHFSRAMGTIRLGWLSRPRSRDRPCRSYTPRWFLARMQRYRSEPRENGARGKILTFR